MLCKEQIIVERENEKDAVDTRPEYVGVRNALWRKPGHKSHVTWTCGGYILRLCAEVDSYNEEEGQECF
jgi:hypothetical protein